MSELLFADTSAWYASIVKDDTFHPDAREFLSSANYFLLTSNYVILETTHLLHLRQGYTLSKKFLEFVQASGILSIHSISPEEHSAAVQLFLQSQGKTSLTDCSSFIVMRKLKIQNAFTFDEDFARAGFSCFPLLDS